jgi:hypothetical protein
MSGFFQQRFQFSGCKKSKLLVDHWVGEPVLVRCLLITTMTMMMILIDLPPTPLPPPPPSPPPHHSQESTTMNARRSTYAPSSSSSSSPSANFGIFLFTFSDGFFAKASPGISCPSFALPLP